MIKNEKARIWVNRIVSLIIAGGLMFLIMNLYVAEKIRKELDECKYEANRLLNDSKAYFENKDYDKAKETLNTLFEKHPGSNETAEGKKVYTVIEDTEKKEQKKQEEMDIKWEAAVGGIQEGWAKTMAAQLREQLKEKANKEKEELEKDMNDVLNEEWEKVKDKVREEWEK